MNVEIKQDGARKVAAVSGRIDTNSASDFQQAIAPLMEGENPDVEVNCADLEYISSSGLRIFLLLKKSVDSRKGNLVLSNMKPQVKEVFDITGFSSIITIL